MQKYITTTSKIILGTVQFGLNYGINNTSGKPTKETVNDILDCAFENGIRMLDTAEAYGDAQELIGQYHRQSKNRFKIITKFSAKRNDLSFSIIERINQDMKILHTSSCYCYMFHSYADFVSYFDKYAEDITRLKKSGVINKLGVSVYTNSEMDEILREKEVDLIQLPFNLLDNNSQRFVSIQRARERGIEIHTRSAFLQGLFFKNVSDLPIKMTELRSSLTQLQKISEKYNIDLASLSLNYVVQQQGINNVLIGVDSVDQLNQNIRSLGSRLCDSAMMEIDLIKVENTNLLNPSNWSN